ncbi:hypothetical protein LPJ55_005120 [Coemansia sp. RSA 990]|nr:hypothetical protein LPJ55_005120 [Coemansia sp. RSA 990]
MINSALVFASDFNYGVAYILAGLLLIYVSLYKKPSLQTAFIFMYNCFMRPIGKHASQQTRLNAFYENQADVYDATRGGLLRGRRTMLKLCAAELQKQHGQGKKLVWVDIGGGTGWNIEQMDALFGLEHFEAIYLVDLCQPLCKVAKQRFKARGWAHVHVVCQDAGTFTLPSNLCAIGRKHADLVTMSYSLSMIDAFYKVIDGVQQLVEPSAGVLGVADFYVSDSRASRGDVGYHCNWLSRMFWQHWFELDHVYLHPSRRNYLEHQFSTIKEFNSRNHFIIPHLVQIPYYVWLGRRCSAKQAYLANDIPDFTLVDKLPTPTASPKDCLLPSTKPIGSNLSATLQPNQPGYCRLPYNPAKPEHAQFSTYIYGFTWEDPQADLDVLDLQKGDSLLIITSAGDNALAYAANTPDITLHCVDMNPCQNHLLELKLAALQILSFGEFWEMFGKGVLADFPYVLDTQLSAHLSPAAYQFWRSHTETFSPASSASWWDKLLPVRRRNLYTTGYSGLALQCFRVIARVLGISHDLHKIANASSLQEQVDIWRSRVGSKLLSPLSIRFLDNPVAMWQLLGVPVSQWNMLRGEGSMSQYVRDTIEPVAASMSFNNENYFYHLVINQQYSPKCCPDYLTMAGFTKLQSLLNSAHQTTFHIHTSTILDTLQSLAPEELTKAVIMDHMDWFSPEEAAAEIEALKRALKRGGFVLWRSAARSPWYAESFASHGFSVEPISVRQPNTLIPLDRVNMYASFYKATKL